MSNARRLPVVTGRWAAVPLPLAPMSGIEKRIRRFPAQIRSLVTQHSAPKSALS
jgi:hypothetical protein